MSEKTTPVDFTESSLPTGYQSEGSDSYAADEAVKPASWWGRLFRRGSRQAEEYGRRLLELDNAIIAYPDASANYVFRGEIYLELGEDELAALDFRRALELAGVELETNRWGLIAQTLQDRALTGLEKIRQRSQQKQERRTKTQLGQQHT